MAKIPLEVFDKNLRRTAFLEKAFGVNVGERLNGVGSLNFSLPLTDPKTSKISRFNFVADGLGSKYRILDHEEHMGEQPNISTYAEHGIATLVDDVMFGSHIIGGTGVYTRDVINYILSQQTVKRWVLDRCDFNKQFEYGFESENLLNALFSVPNLFVEKYMWKYDMTSYPWKVSLVLLDESKRPDFYVRGGKNLVESLTIKTGSDICTRLYLLGYGEGDNQLTISSVNGGKPYLQSPQKYIDKYGLISKVYTDRQFEDAKSLMERGKVLLNAMQEPPSSRTFNLVDLYSITRQSYDKAEIGDITRIEYDDSVTYITSIDRNLDIDGDMQIEMATSPNDIAASIADLSDRQRIEQVYSQGATQIYGQSLQANADASTKAVLSFFIPSEMRIVNAVRAKIRLESFRTYSRATKGGGQTTQTSSSGGSSSPTSSSGGGSNQTSSSGGGSSPTSAANSAQAVTSGSSSRSTVSLSNFLTGTSTVSPLTTGSVSLTTNSTTGSTGTLYTSTGSATVSSLGSSHSHSMNHQHTVNSHYHSIPQHYHLVTTHQHNMSHSHDISHTHTVTVPSHTHSVSIPAHTHSVSIPAHTHSVSIPAHTHSVTIPAHTHEIEHGIFRTGSPTSAGIYVGNSLKANMGKTIDIDLTPYLLNSSGTITRNSWIELGILPNSLAYVIIDIYVQGFVQSRGGGTY